MEETIRDIRNRQRREKYYANRKEEIAKTREWQKNNPEKVKDGYVRFKKNHPNYKKEFKERCPEKFEEQRFKSLMWRNKVTLSYEDFKKLLIKQKGVCVICGKATKNRLSVDHCHKTGKVRGLLCNLCNTSLGGFHDNIELLKKAIKYLKINHDSLSIK